MRIEWQISAIGREFVRNCASDLATVDETQTPYRPCAPFTALIAGMRMAERVSVIDVTQSVPNRPFTSTRSRAGT